MTRACQNQTKIKFREAFFLFTKLTITFLKVEWNT